MVITLKRDAICFECGAGIAKGQPARWYPKGRIYGLTCHEKIIHTSGETIVIKKPQKDFLKVLYEADKKAREAHDTFVKEKYTSPAFAVVSHANPLDDNSPVKKVEGVMFDVCGFVWLELKLRGNETFINWFKKHGTIVESFSSSKRWNTGPFQLAYSKGCGIWNDPWTLRVPSVGYGNGSMGAMEEAGHAFCSHMFEHGVDISMRSRID